MSNPIPTTRLRFYSRRSVYLSFGVLAVAIALFMSSCQTTVPNRDPLGDRFPDVMGESLEGKAVALPLAEPSVLLLGYVQDAQFDADRWLVGLLQVTPPVQILEIPTVAGLFPRLISDTIDGGMRKGIPSEDWKSVVTVYGSDASDIVDLTGNELPRNIRVLLLDSEGKVRWFHDRGFSASKLLELGQAASQLASDE
ncbi:MAG: hypothetical protein ACI8X5_002511 [Planctomycetota bacterium]|jgi:hypothetical protein